MIENSAVKAPCDSIKEGMPYKGLSTWTVSLKVVDKDMRLPKTDLSIKEEAEVDVAPIWPNYSREKLHH